MTDTVDTVDTVNNVNKKLITCLVSFLFLVGSILWVSALYFFKGEEMEAKIDFVAGLCYVFGSSLMISVSISNLKDDKEK